MAVKQPYYNIFLQLRLWVLEEINKIILKLPQTIPCKVIDNNGQTVNVLPTVNTGVTNQLINNVPIAKSKYFNLPFQEGDRGLLVPADYIYNDLVLTDIGFISDPKGSTSRSGYIFIPFTNVSEDYATDEATAKLFSQDGEASLEITNTDIKLKTNEEISWNSLKTFLDNWQTNYNLNVTTVNANNVIIEATFLSLGKPVTLADSTQYNGSYRS